MPVKSSPLHLLVFGLLLSGCASTSNPLSLSREEPESPLPEPAITVSETTTAVLDWANTDIDRPHNHLPVGIDSDEAPWWLSIAPWETEQVPNNAPWPSSVVQDSPQDTTQTTPANVEQLETVAEEPTDLWQRLRAGFSLEGADQPQVKPYIKWYAEHQEYLDRVAERARPFLYDIMEAVEERDMPLEIALLPVVESAFQPFAYSPGRAAGIWQFIPGTGKLYGLKQNWWYDGRRDVPEATRAALEYLSRLNKRFDGDWLLALAAYNTGEGRVYQAVKKNLAKGRSTDFWSLDLPDETRGYVPKLLAISHIVAQPGQYDIDLEPIPNEPYLDQVDIGSQIDLALAAELADMSLEEIYELNPAFNRWATDPDGPHVLSLPLDKIDSFTEALAEVDENQRIRWERHKIRQGETLGHIARKYQTSVELLQEVNNINDKWIRAGQSIVIPVATKKLQHYLSEDQRRLAIQQTQRRGIKVQHTVQKGDTFWDISRLYKVNVSQLASWNGMSPRDTLMPGQTLVVWAPKSRATHTRFASPSDAQTQQKLHYRVRKGDSLARIAKKFRVTVSKLRNWNSLPKGKYLQPGQMLTLYVDVTRQS